MSKGNVYIVEDEVTVLMDLESKVKKLGYSVVGTAVAGCEAIEKAPASKADIVLMDINLGKDPDGIEAAQAIRKVLNVGLIFVTAHDDPATRERACVAEPESFIGKPFAPAMLADELEAIRTESGRQIRRLVAKNCHRIQLLRKVMHGVLDVDEQSTLDRLQKELTQHVDSVAPVDFNQLEKLEEAVRNIQDFKQGC